jgi:hypothetical protein
MLIAKLSITPRDEVEDPTPVATTSVHAARTRNLKLEVRFAGIEDWVRYIGSRISHRLGIVPARFLYLLAPALYVACGAVVCMTIWLSAYVAAFLTNGRIETLLCWAAPVFIAIVLTLRGPLCTIHLITLHPHEPFPHIRRKLINNKRGFVLAVRVLGVDAWRKLFPMFDRDLDESNRSTSYDITHPWNARLRQISWEDYWSLGRYCVGQLLPQSDSEREFGKAAYFTFKQHRLLVRAFLLLIGLSIVIPMCGLWQSSWLPVKQSLAAFGVVWAIGTIVSHRRIMRHLEQWEAVSRVYPFRGSPLFRCTARPTGSDWAEIFTWDIDAPVRYLGLNYSQMYQLVLSIFLVIFLTLLQLVP